MDRITLLYLVAAIYREFISDGDVPTVLIITTVDRWIKENTIEGDTNTVFHYNVDEFILFVKEYLS